MCSYIRPFTCKIHNDSLPQQKTADGCNLQKPKIADYHTKSKSLKSVVCIYEAEN